MILSYALIAILSLWGLSIAHDGFHNDYLSKDKTNAIKGISILMVFIGHSLQYITNNGYEFAGVGDTLFLLIKRLSGQLVVVMFLFYSGFGIGESFKKKGKEYVDHMPTHRILSTIINFDIAVLFFVLLAPILDEPLSIKEIMLSLVGWESIGNSNWYIFCIVACYILSFLVFKFINKNHITISIIISIVAFSFLLSFLKPSYWYNTLWAYPLGILFSFHRKELDCFLKKHWLKSLLIISGLFLISFSIRYGFKGIPYNILSVCFALLVVILSMKVSIGNKALYWIGANLFPFYIYQRLPMIFISKKYPELLIHYPLVFMSLCLLISLLITYAYKYWRVTLR